MKLCEPDHTFDDRQRPAFVLREGTQRDFAVELRQLLEIAVPTLLRRITVERNPEVIEQFVYTRCGVVRNLRSFSAGFMMLSETEKRWLLGEGKDVDEVRVPVCRYRVCLHAH